MLCPVCKLVPLTGRKATAKTCSDKCRSALYRERKQQRTDTSQKDTQQTAKQATDATRPAGLRQHARRADAAKWEYIVSAAADRIIEAIKQQGLHATSQGTAHERVDMHEQLAAQAPKQAAGYRLVLPPQRAGDSPKFSPAGSRSRQVPWYSIAPFEYPDDIRLCDDRWYRIVWVDVQGQRIRLQPGEPVPGLYYFVGPSTKAASAPVPSMPVSAGQPWAPAPTPPTESDTKASLHTADPGVDTAGQATVALSPPASEVEMPAAATEAIPAPATPAPQSQSDGTLALIPPGTAEIVLPDGPLLTSIPQATEAAFNQLLSTLPKIPLEHWGPIYGFVMQVPWMIWLLNEERRKQAVANKLPPPQGPALNLSAKDRELVTRLASTAPSYLIPFCKSLFAFVREHGTDILQFAPVPFHPLPQREQQVVLQALRDPNQRAYMEYICRWQDALLNQEKVPAEPQVKLRSDRKNEIRKSMTDLRAVMLFRQRAVPSSAP